jgi:hypothetical protein
MSKAPREWALVGIVGAGDWKRVATGGGGTACAEEQKQRGGGRGVAGTFGGVRAGGGEVVHLPPRNPCVCVVRVYVYVCVRVCACVCDCVAVCV